MKTDNINQKENKLISIVVVNWNGMRWLKKCLDSLLGQTYENFEIIFVDNASTDESLDFINNNYKDERIKIVKSEKILDFQAEIIWELKMQKANTFCF